MKLINILKSLPPDMRLFNHISGEVQTVAEWCNEIKDDHTDNYQITPGCVIYIPGVSMVFSTC